MEREASGDSGQGGEGEATEGSPTQAPFQSDRLAQVQDGKPYEEWLAVQRKAEEWEPEQVELKIQAPKAWVVRGM